MPFEEVVPTTEVELYEALRVDPGSESPCQSLVFRGVPNASWRPELATSLQRLGTDADKIEEPLLEDFKQGGERQFRQELDKFHSDWDWWTYGQHYGLPTRLLDWTTAPRSALHFATSDFAERKHAGVIYIVNFATVHGQLPDAVRAQLNLDDAHLEDLPKIARLGEGYPTLETFRHEFAAASGVLFFMPRWIDDRMKNQQAILSICSSPIAAMADVLGTVVGACKRVVLSAELKAIVREDLDQNGTDEWQIMSDAAGLCANLKRKFAQRLDPWPP